MSQQANCCQNGRHKRGQRAGMQHIRVATTQLDGRAMGFKLLLLAAMGLGAMYMMHLLAQDWNRIRRPVQQAARLLGTASATLQRGKRAAATMVAPPLEQEMSWVRAAYGKEPATQPQQGTPTIDWKRILSRDPFECLQSLICQLMSGAEAHSEEAVMLMDFLESTLEMAPVKIGRAFSRGLALRGNTERCYDEYPFCLYSAKTMLRMLRWFSETGNMLEQDMQDV